MPGASVERIPLQDIFTPLRPVQVVTALMSITTSPPIPRRNAIMASVLCALTLYSHGQVPVGDVIEATVLYGDERLFENDRPLDDNALEALWDSLSCQPDVSPEQLNELALFRRIRSMDEEGMVALIDSLFDLDEVPYALINEVTHCIQTPPSQEEMDRSDLAGWSVDGAIPCHDLYGAWHVHTPNAYGPDLSAGDRTVHLELTREQEGCGMTLPVHGALTSRFGWRNGRPHNGIDLDLRTGEPVRAMFPGVVRFANTFGSYGRLVVIRHYNGLETYYAHLHRIKVGIGTEVDAGTVIGTGGNTGRSTAPHLHLEVRFKGLPIDPLRFLDLATGSLACNELVLKRTRWSFVAFPRGTNTHVVQRGEHLHAIAQRYGTSVDDICSLNGIGRKTRLTVGQELVVSHDKDH